MPSYSKGTMSTYFNVLGLTQSAQAGLELTTLGHEEAVGTPPLSHLDLTFHHEPFSTIHKTPNNQSAHQKRSGT
jgi:hypothetical protein